MKKLTNLYYDIAIVGSGPAALASLLALKDKKLKICVITGEEKTNQCYSSSASIIHPKIASVNYEEDRNISLPYAIPILPDLKKNAIISSSIGGLANFWGQQLNRYEKSYIESQKLFKDYEDYILQCESIESNFIISDSQNLDNSFPSKLVKNYNIAPARLLVGEMSQLSSSLQSIKNVFLRTAKNLNVKILDGRIEYLRNYLDYIELFQKDGLSVYAKKVFIAAGALGSGKIVSNSDNAIKSIDFCDHVPHMLYTIGLKRILNNIYFDKNQHFNAFTIEKSSSGNVVFYASIYDLKFAPISLIASTLGFPPMFKGLSVPKLFTAINPIQMWTESTIGTYRIMKDFNLVSVLNYPNYLEDNELQLFQKFLRSNGLIYFVRKEKISEGFHYHGVKLNFSSGYSEYLDDYLARSFHDKVVCVDGSIIRKVGCRPHTLTLMAIAKAIVETYLYTSR